MAERWNTGLRWSDVTPRAAFLDRRRFLATAGLGIGTLAFAGIAGAKIAATPSPYSTDEAPNSLEDITGYNNFYEFGFDKSDPARHAGAMTTAPWSVRVEGLVDRPGDYAPDDLLKGIALEERIYRFRCVEAWSMVIPWIGVPLASVLARVGVQPGARYVRFESLARADEMPGVAAGLLDFPYREGLRIDEAMHPLTLLATGLYGEAMPKQNGAPIRLVVPWKYGFKSAKSLVKISLTNEQPVSTWQMLQPKEYGFYANVNPEVDHPRWSQASERRIGGGLFAKRVDTLKFNGYGDLVAGLYAGQDLAVDY
ncbi:protein-methionine-sulfoxide reductase catalytic subunit MsrP [Gemmobacter serpentinus]|uniref:protein-methionine-sulfoxide reductase catalytic subunit MsrP n=1 Tax=Gemmobacter serpentinus TaxID=2652247 RepID=UPI00124D1203|nr:protein-methionine-sulfoxide reductase catalytic subunit MsrP [Gemmobacter serpentinus]